MNDRNWRVLRAADHRHMPWKNGLGVTTELLVEPAGATLETFDWRLSMARIDADGPFSTFHDIDRVLMVLEGSLTLTIDGQSRTFAPDDPALRFAGEAAVYGSLPAQSKGLSRSATDLNLMVRRGRFSGGLSRHVHPPGTAWRPDAITTAVFCKTAGVCAEDGAYAETLGAADLIVLTAGATNWPRLVTDRVTEIYCVELGACTAGRSAAKVVE